MLNVGGSSPRQGPLVRGLTFAVNICGYIGYLILARRLTPRNVTHAFSWSPLRACLVCCATTPTNIGL